MKSLTNGTHAPRASRAALTSLRGSRAGGARRAYRARRPAMGAILVAALAVGCGGGSSGGNQGGGSGGANGEVLLNPATGLSFVVDSNSGGNASNLKILSTYWGRLVDIQDANRVLMHQDFVIGEDIKTNGIDYQLDRNPVTGKEVLTIRYAAGTPGYANAFARLEANVANVLDKGLGANELPPFTMVARNSALVIRFSDLLDDGGNPGSAAYPGTVNSSTIQVFEGYPPATPYQARIFPDPNHGDIVNGKFHSTRVIVDLTISRFDAIETGLPVNALGLSGAVVATQPNFAVRIPTLPDAGSAQFELLENLSGGRLSFSGNGSNDPFSPTLDVVRAARSGGDQLGDPNNGFLVDDILPQILGAQPISMSVTASTGPNEFLANVTFGTKQCASAAKLGDVIESATHTVQVTQAGSNPVNGALQNVAIQLIAGDPSTFNPPLTVVGQYRTTWDPNAGAAPECFVRFSPVAGTPPNVDVSVQADVVVSFSEPMDPASVQSFQSFQLEYGDSPNPANTLYNRVVGNVLPSSDLTSYVLEPSQPLLPPEGYLFSVSSGNLGVRDLAGNSLADALPQIPFTIAINQPRVDSGSVSLDFSSLDEDGNGDPEIRGQFLQDVVQGVVNPRPVTRFSAGVDKTLPIVGSMIEIQNPIQTPLSNLGSKMQGLWRYLDMGFTLLDDTNHNLDVEGLWWEPFDGTPQIDIFPRFEMRLGHCFYAPDEDVNTGLLPKFTQSGVSNNFQTNYADLVEDPPVIVHPEAAGYFVQPINTLSETGRQIASWPMNRELAQEDFVYWTWRDNSKLMLGGPNGVGVDPARATAILQGTSSFQGLYPANQVPSIGMPLLMEYRTWSDNASTGQNGFRIAIAINSSALPYFRVFSTGGILSSGQSIIVDPANENSGKGGINPGNNLKTPSRDNAFYYGQADFVVRVNRFHTIWFDTLATGSSFAPAVLEPRQDVFPTGTQVVLAFRGATGFINNGEDTDPWNDAGALDPYGDPFDATQWGKLGSATNFSFRVDEWPTNNDKSWVSSPQLLNGARYVQVRATMLSNPLNGLTPYVSAIGLSYLR